MPKVSVIIPTYNREDIIGETIKSVLNQTEQDFEVIVVDDGSKDDTSWVVKSIQDGRIGYYYKENEGTPSARNYGLSKAAGQYVAFLDHDDLWPVNFLEVMVSHLEKSTEYGVAYSPVTLLCPYRGEVKSYKKPEGKSGWLTVDLFKSGFIWTSATLIRKSVLKNFYYDESLKRSYEDGDFFLRLSTRTQFLFVPDVEAIRREHGENLSQKVGVLPTRILVLERFYFQLGGNKIVSAKVARRRLSHACRRVAEERRHEANRSAAIALYKRAIRYWPTDLRLYLDLCKTLLLSKKNDRNPNWQITESLPDIEI